MRLYPLGCPVEVAAEQPFSAGAAQGLWPEPQGLFDVASLRFHLADAPARSADLEFQPQADRFLFAAGTQVRGGFELPTRQGQIAAGADSVALLLESVVLTALTWTHLFPLHAACASRGGTSVLLCGDSHAGKSTLAYTLAQAGWTYVSDNSLYWYPADDTLVSGSPVIKLRGRSGPVSPQAEGFASARTAEPGPCVFLRRQPGAARLVRGQEDAALDYFLRYSTRPDRDAAERHYRDLTRRGVWWLEYEEAQQAALLLEQLL